VISILAGPVRSESKISFSQLRQRFSYGLTGTQAECVLPGSRNFLILGLNMTEAKKTEPTNWPDLAMALWDGLTGRKAEITYQFDHIEVSVPHYVGDDCKYAAWKLNGVLKVRTTDHTQVQ